MEGKVGFPPNFLVKYEMGQFLFQFKDLSLNFDIYGSVERSNAYYGPQVKCKMK